MPRATPTMPQRQPEFNRNAGFTEDYWRDKDKRDRYKLCIANALDEAKTHSPGMCLKKSWGKNSKTDREQFLGIFRDSFHQLFRYLIFASNSDSCRTRFPEFTRPPSLDDCRKFLQKRCKEGMRRDREQKKRDNNNRIEADVVCPTRNFDLEMDDVQAGNRVDNHQVLSLKTSAV